MAEPLIGRVRKLFSPLLKRSNCVVKFNGTQDSDFGAAVASYCDDYIIEVVRNRGQEWVNIHCRVRPRPRAHYRIYSVGALAAYLDGASSPYPVSTLEAESKWLVEHAEHALDVSLLNCDELHRWHKRAARHLFR